MMRSHSFLSASIMKTYQKIIDESLRLFNQEGERNVTTNHIANHLSISPGNLYYHFRNKEEIIYQIFLQYKAYIHQHIALPQERTLTVRDILTYLEKAFHAIWMFRFMFYDLSSLLARNPKLCTEYHQFIHEDMRGRLQAIFRECRQLGFIAIEDDDMNAMLNQIWLLVKFWFTFEQTTPPTTPLTEATSQRGIEQVLFLLKPYIQAPWKADFQRALTPNSAA